MYYPGTAYNFVSYRFFIAILRVIMRSHTLAVIISTLLVTTPAALSPFSIGGVWNSLTNGASNTWNNTTTGIANTWNSASDSVSNSTTKAADSVSKTLGTGPVGKVGKTRVRMEGAMQAKQKLVQDLWAKVLDTVSKACKTPQKRVATVYFNLDVYELIKTFIRNFDDITAGVEKRSITVKLGTGESGPFSLDTLPSFAFSPSEYLMGGLDNTNYLVIIEDFANDGARKSVKLCDWIDESPGKGVSAFIKAISDIEARVSPSAEAERSFTLTFSKAITSSLLTASLTRAHPYVRGSTTYTVHARGDESLRDDEYLVVSNEPRPRPDLSKRTEKTPNVASATEKAQTASPSSSRIAIPLA